MQFTVTADSDEVQATLTKAEFLRVFDLLNADKGVTLPVRTPAFRLSVESHRTPGKYYEVVIWFDAKGGEHGSCTCPHHQHRGAWCKHLLTASIVHNRQRVFG